MKSRILTVFAFILLLAVCQSRAALNLTAIGIITGKFEVTPTGAATYSIPISVPPGTAGMEPKLALSYSSQGGNGLLGIGWMMSGLSSITRCPATWAQDGFVDGVDFDANDRLCLDGQRLKNVASGYGVSGTEYRTELESFSRITSAGSINDPSSTFEVRTKAGLIYSYGEAFGASRASFPAPGRSEIYVWAVREIRDTAGNYLTVRYQRDPVSFEHYVDRIDYTGNANAGLTPYNHVQFIYEIRPDIAERYLPGGSSKLRVTRRLTAIQTYTSSQLVREYQVTYGADAATGRSRPTSITECAHTGATSCLPATVLNWQDNPAGTEASSSLTPPTDMVHDDGYSESEVVDVNGDGLPDWVFAFGINGGFYTETWLNTGSGWESDPGYTLPSILYYEDKALGVLEDVNGDGYPDFVYAYYGNRTTYINQTPYQNPGSCGFDSCRWKEESAYQLPSDLAGEDGIMIGKLSDLNGDGLVDFVYSRTVWLNNSAFCSAANCKWILNENLTLPDTLFDGDGVKRAVLSDITGDGLPDYVLAFVDGGNYRYSYINTGAGWQYNANLNLPHPLFLEVGDETRHYGELIDVNGDNLADLVIAYQNNRTTYLNTGNGWVVSPEHRLPTYEFVTARRRDRAGMFADVNGDGLPDYMLSHPDFGYQTYINRSLTNCQATGCHWEADNNFAPGVYLFTNSGKVNGTLADMNGDGLLDGIASHDGSRATMLSKGKTPDLMLQVTNGLGATVGLSYVALTNPLASYTRGRSAQFPNQDSIAPLTVTKAHSASNGMGDTNTVAYKYAGLQVNLRGRGLLGFASVSSTDATSGIADLANYRLDFPFTGMMLASTSIHASTGRILKKTTNTPMIAASNCGGFGTQFPLVSASKQEDYEIQPFSSYIAKTQTTDYQYDGCGNALTVTVANYKGTTSTQDRHVSRSVNTYSGNPGNWILGRLSRTEVTNTLPSGANLKRVSSFTYDLNTGFLTSETVEPASALAITTTYSYDVFGNKTGATVGMGTDARAATTTYGQYGRFPATVTNALGHSETHTYNAAHGGRTVLTGPNGLTTTWQYDPFGRAALEIRSDGTTTTTSYLSCGSLCVSGGVMAIRKQGADGSDAIATLDILEREIAVSKKGFDGSWIQTLTQYDVQNRKARVSTPHYQGDTAHWTEFDYDVLDRVIQQESDIDQNTSGGRTTRFSYAGLVTTQTDANGNDTIKEVNAAARSIRITDELGSSTQYTYDPFGNLTTTTDAAGNFISMSYDIRGRKTAMTDPDMGNWIYTYNAFGELVSQRDAKAQTISMLYDKLGRMTQRNELEGATTWTYDTRWKGALTTVVAPGSYQQSVEYDGLGRPLKNYSIIEGQTFLTQTDYDSQSRPVHLTYPNNFKIKYVYNALGYLTEVRQASDNALYWKLDHMDALGNADIESLGNGVSTTRAYDPARGHLDTILTGKNGGTAIQSLNYKWDSVGNLVSRTDQNQGGLQETFRYDRLNRMIESRRANQTNLNLQYDAIGNVTYKSDVGQYTYEGRPHAVTQTIGPRSSVYGYDASGNMTYDNGRSLEWTSYNLPKRVTQYAATRVSLPVTQIPMLPSISVPDSPSTGPLPAQLVDTMYAPPTDQDGTFKIYWSAPGPSTSVSLCDWSIRFYLVRATKPDFSDGNVIFSSPSAREYTVTGLLPGTYYFKVYTIKEYYSGFFCANPPVSERGRDYVGPHVTTVGAKTSPAVVSDTQIPDTRLNISSLPGNPSGQSVFNQSDFFYGPDRARFKQIVTRTSPPDSKTIYYVGDLYELHLRGAAHERKCFIRVGSRVIAVRNFYGNGTDSTEYLHRDHLNSVDAMTNASGTVLERTSFDAFGKRRPSNWANDPNDVQTNERLYRTHRGYTGHEHLDNVGLIHMNGRVYDPALGRFTSPDPFVQFPESTQGLNRYSYVGNNPLRYTDPSGFVFGIDDAVLAAIALIAAGEIADVPALTQIGFAILCQGCTVGQAFAAGFAGGLISSDGDIRTAVISGATAGAFAGIGEVLGHGVPATLGGKIGKVIAHGGVGGVSSELSGGSFKEGFLSAGFTQAVGQTGLINDIAGDNVVGNTMVAAVIGGTGAELGGGKFANGAKTAAFLQATAEAAGYFESNVGGEATLRPGENQPGDPFYKYDQETGQQFVQDRAKNVLGDNEPGHICSQGSACSKTLNLVPGLNGGVARTHDYWFNSGKFQKSLATNVPLMLPATVVGYGAIIGNATQGWQNDPMVWHAISQDYDRDRDRD